MRKFKFRGHSQSALFNRVTTILLIVMVGLTFSACEPLQQVRNSRHAIYCNCTHIIDGDEITLDTPNEREELLLDRIIDNYGITKRPYKLCKARRLPNRIAALATNKQYEDTGSFRYIIYDESYFKTIDSIKATFILGHELGHHLSGHVLDSSVPILSQELEADEFAGNVLYKTGHSLEEALNIIPEYAVGSSTQPNGYDSRVVIELGFRKAANNDGIQIEKINVEEIDNAPSIENPPPVIPEVIISTRETPGVVTPKIKVNKAAQLVGPEKTIARFIMALGHREFKKAYAMQNVPYWGKYNDFSNKYSFGGIIYTNIITYPALIDCLEQEEGNCTKARIFVRYHVKDPINDEDECRKLGMVYGYFFELVKFDNAWIIIDFEETDKTCKEAEA